MVFHRNKTTKLQAAPNINLCYSVKYKYSAPPGGQIRVPGTDSYEHLKNMQYTKKCNDNIFNHINLRKISFDCIQYKNHKNGGNFWLWFWTRETWSCTIHIFTFKLFKFLYEYQYLYREPLFSRSVHKSNSQYSFSAKKIHIEINHYKKWTAAVSVEYIT